MKSPSKFDISLAAATWTPIRAWIVKGSLPKIAPFDRSSAQNPTVDFVMKSENPSKGGIFVCRNQMRQLGDQFPLLRIGSGLARYAQSNGRSEGVLARAVSRQAVMRL
jgi:hypothetical protein